jgi:hypothetical protein
MQRLQNKLQMSLTARLRQGYAGQPSIYLGPVSRSCIATKAGGGERDRTDDLLRARQALSQLSYTPVALTSVQFSEVI